MGRGAIWHVAGGSEVLLPDHAIIGLRTGSVPSGWTAINPGRFIRCSTSAGTGGSYSLGTTGSGGGGNHSSANGTRFTRDLGGSANHAIGSPINARGNHTHTVDLSYKPSSGRLQLIKLSNPDGQLIPKNGVTFSAKSSLEGPTAHYSTLDGYHLWGTSSGSTVSGSSKSASSRNTSFSHIHHDVGQSSSGGGFGPDNQERPSGGPSHSHSCSASWSVSIYAYVLKAFYETEEAEACPNQIIIYENGYDIPEGWAYCNGSNGTPNLHDRIIKMGTGVGAEGNGTYSVSGSLSSAGSHNHNHAKAGNEWQRSYCHDNNVSHTHSYSKSGNYTPEYKDYRFLMRLPN